MIIDAHSHVCAAPELYVWKSSLLASRGAHGYKSPSFFTRIRPRPCGNKKESQDHGFGGHGRAVSLAASRIN